jgi:hypothetical protein
MLFRGTVAVYCENYVKQIYYVDRMQNYSTLKQVVYTYITHWNYVLKQET